MPTMKHSKRTFEYKPEEIKKLIASDLKVSPDCVEVDFIIQEVGGDPMDRFPGRDEVTKINVVVTEK